MTAHPTLTEPLSPLLWQDEVPASRQAVVLVVDDTPTNLTLMGSLLQAQYRVKVANNGEKALAIVASDDPPDLVLLDVMMPDLDGYEVCRRMKASPSTRHIPVIFLTARAESTDEAQGFTVGAVDYITKPISPPVVRARVRTHVALKRQADLLRAQRTLLRHEVELRTRELQTIQDVTIYAMASLAETRDSETGNHVRRTQLYLRALARHLQQHPRFKDVLTDAYIAILFKCAPLHDIGKIGIPDRILLKPGRLTPDEFEIMKLHTVIGRDAIVNAERALGARLDFLDMAKELAYSHQEKWDGSGYPEGLVGEAIPLSGRLMAIADVYDALVSRRVYKDGMPHAEAVRIIEAGRGQHFDPDLVDAFLQIHEAFRHIAESLADSDEALAAKRRDQARYLAASAPD